MAIATSRSRRRQLTTPILLLITASLTGCASWQQVLDAQKDADQLLRAGQMADAASAEKAKSEPRALPQIPDEIQSCLKKRACVKGKGGKINAKCTKADGIVADQHRVIEEHRACTEALLKWYAEVRKAEAMPADGKSRHPQSGEPAATAKKKGAEWP